MTREKPLLLHSECPKESDYAHLVEGLGVEVNRPYEDWDWRPVAPVTSYAFARLQEYRDGVIEPYRLYNALGLAHARRVLTKLPMDARILDAGGGTGRKAIPLARDGYRGITLLDVAPGWLRLARERAREAGVEDALDLVEGDIRHLGGIPDGAFDAVLCLGGPLSYCGDLPRALHELVRVLRPEGVLLADMIHNRLATLLVAAERRDLSRLERVGALPRTAGATAYGAVGEGFGLGGPGVLPEELAAWAEDAGLAEVRVGTCGFLVPRPPVRIGPDTDRLEATVVGLELQLWEDPRFLGAGALVLEGRGRSPRS